MGRVNEQPEGISTHLEEVPSRALFTYCVGRHLPFVSGSICHLRIQHLVCRGFRAPQSPFMYVPLSTSQARVFGCDWGLPFCALKIIVCGGASYTTSRVRQEGRCCVISSWALLLRLCQALLDFNISSYILQDWTLNTKPPSRLCRPKTLDHRRMQFKLYLRTISRELEI